MLILADFDPEEDGAVESDDEGSSSQESNDERLGTEHYVAVGYEIDLRVASFILLTPRAAKAHSENELRWHLVRDMLARRLAARP